MRGPSGLGVERSDEQSFRRLGYPGVLVTDTSFLRDDVHHSGRDTPDRLNYPRMARLVEALHSPLWDAEAPERCF